jgi:hypothetical protein
MNGLELLIQGLIAVGTLAVAALAIWGEWFREKLAGPKLELTLHDPEGEPIPAIHRLSLRRGSITSRLKTNVAGRPPRMSESY